jgi:hypothetical protein
LKSLSTALSALVKTNAMRYIQFEVIKRTVFASLMSSLLPMAWLKIGQIIGKMFCSSFTYFLNDPQDNDWMNSKALAVKAGAVLGRIPPHCRNVKLTHFSF